MKILFKPQTEWLRPQEFPDLSKYDEKRQKEIKKLRDMEKHPDNDALREMLQTENNAYSSVLNEMDRVDQGILKALSAFQKS